MADADNRIVLLAGASGLTGQRTLEALLEAPEIGRVIAVSRRPLGNEHSRLANRIVKFDALESQLKGLTCEAALCCIGSTRRARGRCAALRGDLQRRRGPQIAQPLPAHQGRDGAGARGAGLRIARHPAALAAARLAPRDAAAGARGDGGHAAHQPAAARALPAVPRHLIADGRAGDAGRDSLGQEGRAALHLARYPGARAAPLAACAGRAPGKGPGARALSAAATARMRVHSWPALVALLLLAGCSLFTRPPPRA